ncbi:hypothetical protein ODV97_19330 [Enterococcus gallinarum]|nr:hypothetical protein [Enterococcus gallinarum]
MALDDEWHRDETSELYKKIMACSEELRRLTSINEKIRRMSQEELYALTSIRGYTPEIADYYGVSVSYLNKWQAKNKGIIV